MEVWMTVGQKRFSKFTRGYSVFHTSMRNKQVEFNPYIYTLSKLSPVLAMKYPFLNTQQGGIQNSRRIIRLIRHACFLHGKMDVKSFLMFIAAENTGSVNIQIYGSRNKYSYDFSVLTKQKCCLQQQLQVFASYSLHQTKRSHSVSIIRSNNHTYISY